MDEIPAPRIEVHGKGVGEFSEEDIRQRAREIARMDGRADATSADLIRARDDLCSIGAPVPPEVDGTTADIQEWDEPPGASGHMTPRMLPEDEVSATEILTEEGLEEADHDQRLSVPSAKEEE